ncbi:MAG: hypothetical protein EOO46_19575 [Flavobacterium sp.]|nr:MAG: hypothetical protein EOO46_19575 [Flavobacterium sp.]
MKLDNHLNKGLKTIASKLNEDASELARKGEVDYLLFALRGLVSYTSLLFDRLVNKDNFPIEHIAMSARNLFECYLLVTYIINDSSKAKDFISQKAFEELEINEGFLSLTTTNTSKQNIKMIQDRMDYIKLVIENNDLTPSRHWNVSHLATQTDNKLEYDVFFKLHSKYIHPSSWIVNSPNSEYDNPVFKSIFLSQGQIYTRRIVNLINKYQDK